MITTCCLWLASPSFLRICTSENVLVEEFLGKKISYIYPLPSSFWQNFGEECEGLFVVIWSDTSE